MDQATWCSLEDKEMQAPTDRQAAHRQTGVITSAQCEGRPHSKTGTLGSWISRLKLDHEQRHVVLTGHKAANQGAALLNADAQL